MFKQFAIVLLLAPFFCFSQTEIYRLPTSPDMIRIKSIALREAGKLDSLKTHIKFFKDYFNRIDSVKQFYVYTDTVKYSDSSFAIGQIILDSFMEFERGKLGEWTFYYPSGKVYSKGSYSIGVYTECQVAGPVLIGYSFKTGAWKYWYDNGVLMAEGIYEPTQVEKETNCSIDAKNISKATSKWNLFDNTGIKINNGEMMILKINSNH
jgi:hypothetical protein